MATGGIGLNGWRPVRAVAIGLALLLAESAELFAAATQPKDFWIVEGAKHQDFLRFDPVGHEASVVGFLTEWLMGLHLRLHQYVDGHTTP